MKSNWNFPATFFICLLLLNAILAIYSTPVTDAGDAGAYIRFSEVLAGKADANLAHRSPLLSLIMAGFMLFIQPPDLFQLVICFHYLLITVAAYLLYLIFQPLFKKRTPAIIISLLFNLSFSTIYYANIIYTEILAMFFLVVIVFFLLRFYHHHNKGTLFLLGIAMALLSLARFSAIPLIVPIVGLVVLFLFMHKVSFLTGCYSLFLFLAPYFVIINLWCLYNYSNNGFYGLFPRQSGVPRNVVVASIQPENTVSEENEVILDIFLEARGRYLRTKTPPGKGSFAYLDKYEILDGLYSGYPIYQYAKGNLIDHFGLPDNAGEYELGEALSNFYKEIFNQNQSFIFKMRFISFFSGFRATATMLPAEYGKINSNVLPAILFKLYKVGFVLISISVFISFFVFLWQTIKSRFKFDIVLLVSFVVVWSFWGINFYFNTVNDANRFKFPAEPFILGLFVFYFYTGVQWIKKCRSSQ